VGNENLKIGFIGGGNMAQAIVGGLLRAGHAATSILVAEPAPAARARVAAMDSAIALAAGNAEVAGKAAVLVLAVKPQVMPAVLAELAPVSRPAGQLVMSVAAGITLEQLARGLAGSVPAVRVMPNQPALVGEGMSVLVASPGVSAAQKAQAQYVAEAAGRALWIGDESLMDAVTAVSGSGPAYFYLLMEIMEETAVELGLPRETARVLVRQTALGAARTAGMPDSELAALRAGVTSPGGTTAAALAVMDAAGIRDTLRRALIAARDRGAELGRGSR
jgi:pyrroline-5-carboxylate reductase